MYKYIHTYIYIHIHMSAHIHTYIYTYTHTKCAYERKHARLERQRDSESARSRCRRRNFCTSLSFDAIKPHSPMQRLHCTLFLKHQYPSTPHPLFLTYPSIVRGPRASAVLLSYTDQMNRVHSSKEGSRSFTMDSCVVVEIGGKSAVQQNRSK